MSFSYSGGCCKRQRTSHSCCKPAKQQCCEPVCCDPCCCPAPPTPTPTPPTAVNDAYSTPNNALLPLVVPAPGVLGNDIAGVPALPFTVIGNTQPATGALTGGIVNPDGSFTYTPAGAGTFTFTYTITGGSTATVSINVFAPG